MSIKTRKYKVHDAKFSKELSGYRIALFSDSHNAYFGKNSEDIIGIFEKEQVDTVLFVGDANNTFRNSNDPSKGFDNVFDLFNELAQKFEVYYVNGNHEERWKKLCIGLSGENNFYFSTRNKLAKSGIHFLDNESAKICNDKINLIGLNLPLEYYKKKSGAPSKAYLEMLVGKSDDSAYNILMAHTPNYFTQYGEWGADLVLSGHIHGGLVRLPFIGGVLSPYRSFFPKYDYGYFENDKCKMIISSGCGDHNLRDKITNPLEVVIIELI